MLDYLRKRMAELDSFTVTLTAYDDMYEGARITALDETGIVITIECRNVTICLPWGAVLEIEIED